MAVSSLALDFSQAVPQVETEAECWYGRHPGPRHEKIVAQRLEERGVTAFCLWSPKCTGGAIARRQCSCRYLVVMYSRNSRPTDRNDYACYASMEYSVWSAPGVRALRFRMGKSTRFGVWSNTELPWSSHPFLKVGQRVRIRSGALDGMEGILLSRNGDRTLVISIDAIQRSLAVRVEGIRSRTCLTVPETFNFPVSGSTFHVAT